MSGAEIQGRLPHRPMAIPIGQQFRRRVHQLGGAAHLARGARGQAKAAACLKLNTEGPNSTGTPTLAGSIRLWPSGSRSPPTKARSAQAK